MHMAARVEHAASALGVFLSFGLQLSITILQLSVVPGTTHLWVDHRGAKGKPASVMDMSYQSHTAAQPK